MSREWDIKRQAQIARESFDARPDWVKRISHFAGTNTAPLTCYVCLQPLGPRGLTEDGGETWRHLRCEYVEYPHREKP